MNFLLPRNPSVPIQPQRGEDVKDDVSPHDAEIAPSGRVLRAELVQIDVGAINSAKLAIRCGAVVGEVATKYVFIGGHILATCLVGARIEFDKFNGGADDGVVG